MARHYKGKARGHRGAGYAAAGHAAKSGFDGYTDCRHCFAASFLCCADGARIHPAAAGRGHCGSEKQGSPLWTSAQSPAGELPQCLPEVALRQNDRYGSRSTMRNATVYLSVPCQNLRKSHFFVNASFYKKVYLPAKYPQICFCTNYSIFPG